MSDGSHPLALHELALVWHQTLLSLRLNFRNRMAVIYGYLFPLIFLVAFWAIWRNDEVPLALHMGQFLTITVLGGACFGLPTTLVSERERGMWRRFRLAPVRVWVFIAALLSARYVLLLTAALLQLALGFAFGMPTPLHPFDLWLAFTVTAMGFIGFGLVVAMLADTVPAVQALGQCIFLPMLVVGGVAVPLNTLPGWAQHLSAFFPGRYAVEILQAAATGNGFCGLGFDVLALVLTGAAGSLAAAMMFRWDGGERFAAIRGKGWLALAFGMWLLVGGLAEAQYRITPRDVRDQDVPPPRTFAVQAGPASWQTVTDKDVDGIAFDRLPPDDGIVVPIAHADEDPDPMIATQLDQVRAALPDWALLKTADPVQRTRNYLAVLAVPDLLQMEQLERFLPRLILSRLQLDVPARDLPKILYWIALHPDDGDDSAIRALKPLGLPAVTGPTDKARGRIMLYAFKFLGRLTGHLSSG